MKRALFALGLVVALTCGAKADNVSSELLSKMGLGGMQVISDSEGLEVRGQGYNNVVFGVSFAVSGHSFAAGSYYASGSNYAAGSSKSIAISARPRHYGPR